MRDNTALLRDRGTEVSFAGQSRGMWDGWKVCISTEKLIQNTNVDTHDSSVKFATAFNEGLRTSSLAFAFGSTYKCYKMQYYTTCMC